MWLLRGQFWCTSVIKMMARTRHSTDPTIFGKRFYGFKHTAGRSHWWRHHWSILTSHNICSRTSFLRADTEKFRTLVTEWMDLDIVSEWKGKFTTDDPNGECNNEFFGLPSQPPFYVGNGGIDWSAMPCHFNSSRHISGVEYDSGRAPLASTSRCDDAKFDFLVDHVLFQAGGIVIRYTPGFKAAAFRNGTVCWTKNKKLDRTIQLGNRWLSSFMHARFKVVTTVIFL